MSHQAMTVILRDFRKQDVSEDELTVLLSFVEEDIYDHQRQSTAFPLLKVRTTMFAPEVRFLPNTRFYQYLATNVQCICVASEY